jgi:two-component system response regulator HydG
MLACTGPHLGRALQDRVTVLSREIVRHNGHADLVGATPSMENVFRLVEAASAAAVTVLILGETGTGKELVARAIHTGGPRQAQPFVAINCSALSEQLLESELFGHRKGACTGATERREGLFSAADGGTVFLDEVGEMSPAMQAKLLRVLETGEILPVGENTPRWVDVRVISATHRDLTARVESGEFRRDLFYRLNVFPIEVPPLRHRRADLPMLVAHLLRRRPRSWAGRRSTSTATRSMCWRATTGPATSASCATCSNAPASSRDRVCRSRAPILRLTSALAQPPHR